MIRLETVRTPDRFWQLEGAWKALWARADGNVFQRFDWLGAWWRAAGEPNGFRLNLVLAWHRDDLVAVAPLITRRYRGLRVLEWAAKDCSDYCDVMIAPELDKVDLVVSLWRHVSAGSRFDLAYIARMRHDANAQLLAGVTASKSVRLRPSHRAALATGVNLREWTSSKAWFQTLGKKGRNNHARGWRILETSGPVGFRLLEHDEDIAAALDRICALKQSWADERRVSPPVLQNDAALLRALVQMLARAGSLRLFVLECDGQIVAASLNIVDRDRLLAFVAAYDPTFDRASPGTILMVEYIRWAIDNGFAMVDFLCGDETYKDRFADMRSELASFTGARTPLGWVALVAETGAGRAKPALTRIARKVRAHGDDWRRRVSNLREAGPVPETSTAAPS